MHVAVVVKGTARGNGVDFSRNHIRDSPRLQRRIGHEPDAVLDGVIASRGVDHLSGSVNGVFHTRSFDRLELGWPVVFDVQLGFAAPDRGGLGNFIGDDGFASLLGARNRGQEELLRGQKRGIAVALRKAQEELRKLERRAASGRIQREVLEDRVQKALGREHLSDFVIATVSEGRGKLSLDWQVDAARRRLLERTRLGRRVLCTDRHTWSNGRIAYAFRGQWNVEELFRRAKKGGVAPWGPSHQWADSSLRLHTFATVVGLTLVSLARLALGRRKSAQSMMKTLAEVKATLVRVRTKERGRRATVMLAPDLSAEQRKSVKTFDLGRWMPILLSSRSADTSDSDKQPSA